MLEHLSIIFGSHIGPIYLGDFANPIIQNIFGKFNIVMLSIGVILISYTSLVSTINTAQDGQIMGKKWSSIWIPLRSILGVSVMAPMPGSGYSIIQAFAMWLIIQGCNVANETWSVVVDYLEQGVSISKAVELNPGQKNKLQNQGEELTWELLNSAVCMASVQRIANESKQGTMVASHFIAGYGTKIKPYPTKLIKITRQDGIEYDGTFNIGIPHAYNSDGPLRAYAEVCGSYKVQGVVPLNELDSSLKELAHYAKEAAAKKQLALEVIFKSIWPLAEKIADLPDSNIAEHDSEQIKKHIQAGGNIYVDIISDLIKPKVEGVPNSDREMIEKLRQSDWTSIGALYLNLENSSEIELLDTAIKNVPIPSTVPSCNLVKAREYGFKDIQELGYLATNAGSTDEHKYLCTKLSVAYSTHQNMTALAHAGAQEAEMSNIVGWLQKSIKEEIKEEGGGNPILSQMKFGKRLLGGAEFQLWQSSNLPMNMATILSVVQWLCGAVLVFYLPLIPCIMYLVAVLGWFLLVIENFFVLPLIALGLIMPSRDEIGNVAANLTLLFNTVIRPMLMVLSFILAIRVYQIAVELINFTVLNAITTNVTFMSASSLAPGVAIIFHIVLILILANLCFSLPYQIPNRIAVAIQNALSSQGNGHSEVQSISKGTTLLSKITQGTPAITKTNKLSEINKYNKIDL